ncbi:MAG: LytR/AlgR family response regulator transcription factor [Oscillospiraceae bacterium]
MNYIICDDNREFANSFCLQLKELEPDCGVIQFNTEASMLFAMPDIAGATDAIFMDIQLTDSSGIELAAKLAQQYPNIRIVYITGYNELAQHIFECPPDVFPTAFLVKPIKRELLQNALNRIRCGKQQEVLVPFKSGRTTCYIKAEDIFRISVFGRKLSVLTTKESLEFNGTLADCMKVLPEGFVQCHKSYCVNLRRIKEINGWHEIVLTNEETVPISRGFADGFRTAVTLNHNLVGMLRR